MNSLTRILVSSTVLFLLPQLALAVQPRGLAAASPSSASTSSVVERGGTVNSVNSTKRTIVVDGVTYGLPSTYKLYPPSGEATQKTFKLKAGMKIRFSTARNYSSGQDEVREVWVVSSAGS